MANATTPDDVICIAPQLEPKGADTIQKFINMACLSIDEDSWGDKAVMGTSLLAAHLMTYLLGGAGAPGAVKRKKVGDEEIEFDNKLGDSASGQGGHELNTTSYGRQFLACRRSLVVTPMLTGC